MTRTEARDPLPKVPRPRSRRATVSAYDHRVGRRDDVMCHGTKSLRSSPLRGGRSREAGRELRGQG